MPHIRSLRRTGRPARRSLVAALVVLVSTAGLAVVTQLGASADAALRDAAQARGKYFGTALAANLLSSNPGYAQVARTEFGQVTPENEMKWDATEPSRGSFSFAAADSVVSFARANSQVVRGHTLVWHSQLPGWLSGGNFDTATTRSIMNNHISTVAGHFRGQLLAWDVVNEPFNEDGTRRQSIFQQRLGNGYIAEALRAARAADPTAKLYINDFNIDGLNAKSNAMFALAQSLLQQGVPLDGIGIQGHLILNQVPASFQQNIQRFADLGLDVAITELDIRMQLPVTADKLTQQAANYRTVTAACLAVTRCVGITVWGVDDGHSWIPGVFPDQGAALLFDANLAAKPAYQSVTEALGGTPPPPPPPPGGCTVSYHADSWADGFVANITVTNGGSTAITGWTLAFTFGGNQRITNAWNSAPTQSGGAVSLANLGYNATIGAGGGTVSMGFQATYSGTNTDPPQFQLNGVACALA